MNSHELPKRISRSLISIGIQVEPIKGSLDGRNL